MIIVGKYAGETKCPGCRFAIVPGDEVEDTGNGIYAHRRCAEDAKDGHTVEWRYADSVLRADAEQREMERVAPLGKQGKCPVCQLELPMTGVCDDHGRPS